MRRMPAWVRRRFEAVPGEYLVLCALFVASRVVLDALGLRYRLELGWMFLDDPARLQHRLVDSLVNFHVYPPGMNLLTGLFLKLSPGSIDGLAHMLYGASGLLLCGSLLYLLRAAGVPRAWAVGVSAAFGLTPPAIYFEHLYLYTYPTATLLCFGGACLHRALQRGSVEAYALFFVCGALLGILRSTFHLSWFFTMVVLALLLCGRGQRLRVLSTAALPLALLLALYVKNYARFDSFGATSAGGANLTLVTVRRLPKELRTQWMRSRKLSPVANISVFAPPRAYVPVFGDPQSKRWPELSALEHSTGRPNYNHWFFMKANRLRAADARTVIAERPLQYVHAVLRGLQQFFGPSTKWHPHAGKPGGPHDQHEQVLGGYTYLYNRVVHGWPSVVGLYSLLPVILAMALHRVWQLRGALAESSRARAEVGMLLFGGLQICYVTVVSSLFTGGESARYRFQCEALLWLLGAATALQTARWLSRRIGHAAPRRSAPVPDAHANSADPF